MNKLYLAFCFKYVLLYINSNIYTQQNWGTCKWILSELTFIHIYLHTSTKVRVIHGV